MQECHVHIWLAAANLHESGHKTFSRSELLAQVDRLFQDRRPGVTAFMDGHANASSPKANRTVYSYLLRVGRGIFRLCRKGDPVHPSRVGAKLHPDQSDLDESYWPLWRTWSQWQEEGAVSSAESAAAADGEALAPNGASQ